MLFSALESETALFNTMHQEERLLYALTRMIECEEVWSLGNQAGWEVQELEGTAFIPLWPYRQLANDYLTDDTKDLEPQATSLEQFVYGVLDACRENSIMLDVFPLAGQANCFITPDRLYELLNGMLESSEYSLEG